MTSLRLGIFEPQHQRKRCLMRPGRRHPPSCWVALAAYGQKQVDHKKPGFTLLLFINDLAGGGCALQNVRGCALQNVHPLHIGLPIIGT